MGLSDRVWHENGEFLKIARQIGMVWRIFTV